MASCQGMQDGRLPGLALEWNSARKHESGGDGRGALVTASPPSATAQRVRLWRALSSAPLSSSSRTGEAVRRARARGLFLARSRAVPPQPGTRWRRGGQGRAAWSWWRKSPHRDSCTEMATTIPFLIHRIDWKTRTYYKITRCISVMERNCVVQRTNMETIICNLL